MDKQLESVQYWNGSLQYPIQHAHRGANQLRQDVVSHEPALRFIRKFDYIVLICPTFAFNRTLYQFAERDLQLYVICD